MEDRSLSYNLECIHGKSNGEVKDKGGAADEMLGREFYTWRLEFARSKKIMERGGKKVQ